MKHPLIIFIICYLVFWLVIIGLIFKTQPKTIKSVVSYGTVEQYTCSGRLLKVYDPCFNIKDENGWTCWDVAGDITDDVIIKKIKGGIIRVHVKIKKK